MKGLEEVFLICVTTFTLLSAGPVGNRVKDDAYYISNQSLIKDHQDVNATSVLESVIDQLNITDNTLQMEKIENVNSTGDRNERI